MNNRDRRIGYCLATAIASVFGAVHCSGGADSAGDLPSSTQDSLLSCPHCGMHAKEQLGKKLFFDKRLSSPEGQACAACHGPSTGFTGPDETVNRTTVVYPGAVHTRFGNRKPPASAYVSDSPSFHFDAASGAYVGGQFWDGRAATLVDQAKGPFLNPAEQNNKDAAAVVKKVQHGPYAWQFYRVFGPNAFADVDRAYNFIAEAIAAYESSAEVNPFSSKYDYYLAGKVKLTRTEAWGLALFNGKGKCSNCHPSESKDGRPPVFTDYGYDNLGVPKNPDNPFYRMPPELNPDGTSYIDRGLGAVLNDPLQDGKFKGPTLRNVDKRPSSGFAKAYMHNGVFKSLKEVVHFYNTRDLPNHWPPPEVLANVNTQDSGNLGLSDAEEDAIVAFMKTLSDGYRY